MTSAIEIIRRARSLGVMAAAMGLMSCALDSTPVAGAMRCSTNAAGETSGKVRCSTAEEPARDGLETAEPGPTALASVLAQTGGQVVDDLARDADTLSPEFAAILGEFMALESFPGAFAEEDLRNVHILPASHPGAEQFLTDGHSAITLDSLVIFEEERYDAISGWDAAWEQVLAGTLRPEDDRALFTTLHELVHVRQFREMGREQFLSEYLADAVGSGEQSVKLEREAYEIAPGEDSWSRKAIAGAQRLRDRQ